MNPTTTSELAQKTCRPCEQGVLPLATDEVHALLAGVRSWELSGDGQRIRRRWVARNFMAAIDFFNRVAAVAEAQGHHPDLHLEGYRNVTVELWTHAIGGLSENDFILAARINELPFEVKKGRT
jgi:4a-hydroxytetrahydrobiopterin dehydratase